MVVLLVLGKPFRLNAHIFFLNHHSKLEATYLHLFRASYYFHLKCHFLHKSRINSASIICFGNKTSIKFTIFFLIVHLTFEFVNIFTLFEINVGVKL